MSPETVCPACKEFCVQVCADERCMVRKELLMKHTVLLLSLLVLLSSCVNLKEVRDYAAESAKFSSNTELTSRFRNTYNRQKPYLEGDELKLAAETDRKVNEIYADLIKIHDNITLYMKTLAKLAGDDTFDVSKGIESVAGGIKSHELPGLTIDKKQVDAFSNLAKITAKWITSAYQQSSVQDMVKEGDAPLQVLLSGMNDLVRYYRKTNENEKANVLGQFEALIPFVEPKDRLLAMLSRVHLQSKLTEYQVAETKFDEAERGTKKIADGHTLLLNSVGKLDAAEVRTLLQGIAKDIKIVRKNIETVRD
jgi:hypothetical protein